MEDDRHTRRLFKVALTAAGFHVLEASDGLDALRILDLATPSLILLDLGLPRLSGVDVVREIATRANMQLVPIVVVTGLDTTDLPQIPWMTVLPKPIDLDVLVHTIEMSLRQVKKGRQST